MNKYRYPASKAVWVSAVVGGIALMAVSACSASALPGNPSGKRAAVKISLLGLNDLHGNIESKAFPIGSGANQRSMKIGGVEIMGAYFDAARRDNPGRTLLLDSGDIYQGTLVSNHFQGKALVLAYNALGVSATTLGNHEFDYGDRKDASAARTIDPQGALKEILSLSAFPALSVNVTPSDNEGLPPFPNIFRSKLFDLNGIKVGVLGVTTFSTPQSSSPKNLIGLAFRPFAKPVLAEVKNLRSQGAAVVVLLAHAGGVCDLALAPSDGDKACHTSEPDEITALLDELPSHTLDAVFAGHNHLAQAHFIRGTPVVQTTGFGKSFSMVNLWVRPDAAADAPQESRIEKIDISKPTYFCHQHFAQYASCNPEEVENLLKGNSNVLGKEKSAVFLGQVIQPKDNLKLILVPYQKQITQIRARILSEFPVALKQDRTKESPTSNCIVDLLKRAAEARAGRPFDACVTHSGGIRTGLPAGKITYGDLFEVLPIDGGLLTVEITGRELEAFGIGLSRTIKSIPVVSSPWKVRMLDRMEFPRYRGFLDQQATALLPGGVYQILTDEFNVAQGGAHDAVFAGLWASEKIKVVAPSTRDLIADFLSHNTAPLPASCLGGTEAARMVPVAD